jgi:hypothetical protein
VLYSGVVEEGGSPLSIWISQAMQTIPVRRRLVPRKQSL